MKKILKIAIIPLICILLAVILTPKNKEEIANADEDSFIVIPMNPEDPLQDRNEEQIAKYYEHLEQEKEYQAYLDNAKIEINEMVDEAYEDNNIDHIFNNVGNVLEVIGNRFSYERFEELDSDKIETIFDRYLANSKNFIEQPIEYEEDRKLFDEIQQSINNIDLDLPKDELYLKTLDALQYATVYLPDAEKLDWSHWIQAAKNCSFFSPTDSLISNNKQSNNLLTALGINNIQAYDKTMGTTVGSSVTLGSNQTTVGKNTSGTVLSDSGSYDNRYTIRYVNGSTQTVYISTDGLYKITAVGGNGGTDDPTGAKGGIGGTTVTYAMLTKGTVLYVNVGGFGMRTAEGGRAKNRAPNWAPAQVQGGYNGGGWGITRDSWNSSDTQGQGGSGGGATSVALQTGTLSSVSASNLLAVAGGGGGGSGIENGSQELNQVGGGGGGTNGNDGNNNSGSGGKQNAGGTPANTNYSVQSGSYGQGGSSNRWTGGGGGGGYYGGAGGIYRGSISSSSLGGGGGGSGYVKNSSITLNGTTYTSSMSNGSNGGQGGTSGNETRGGSAKIELLVVATKLNKPTITSIGTDGIVKWNSVDNASSYALSMDNSSWTNVGNVTSYNFNTSITSTKGSRTVYVKALGSGSYTDSESGSKTVTVNSMIVDGDSGVNKISIDGTEYNANASTIKNYISGASANIKAIMNNLFVFKKWRTND